MNDHSVPENQPNSPSQAIEAFMEAFGEMDIYTQIVIEEFMEALLNAK